MVTHQQSLLGSTSEPRPRSLETPPARTDLGEGAWIELLPSFVEGEAALLERLIEEVGWRAERRPMYDRVVDVPRLVRFYDEGVDLPHLVLYDVLAVLNSRYEPELGEPLRTVGMCLYRDGRDSVAWHGDTIGRASSEDTIVAIVSLGAPRRMLLRPRRGGPSMRLELGRGDLFVMGGTCQRTFEHSVPKTARQVGARVSVQFRPRGVR
jgi:alkylated DNA repair dioxygenase AlkB